MELELGLHATHVKKEQISKLLGICEVRSPFYGIVDCHRQSVPCIGHLIDLELMTRLLDAMLRQVISQDSIPMLEARHNGFIYSCTGDRFSTKTKMVLLKGQTTKPTGALTSSYLFQGLVDPYLLQLVYGLLALRGSIMFKHH